MFYSYSEWKTQVHRLIPSRFPPVSLFDWAESQEELEHIAQLEGMTNDRLNSECGNIYLVAKEDWIGGPGSTLLMAAFTHPGYSRFSDGTFGVYYAGDSQKTAIAETKFHREQFLSASRETACLIQMRECLSYVTKKLIDICHCDDKALLQPDPASYEASQTFGREARIKKEWGILYPSIRMPNGKSIAIFRPPALTIPIQGCHFDYIWDGNRISEIRLSKSIS